jgi:aerobic-type carbon monoxide dehydrogenase small subunit (CoxS/CutS family)
MSSFVLKVNGQQSRVNLEGHETLLEVLRTQLGLTGTKRGCDQGVCGSCTVLINGLAARSCLCLAALTADKTVVTVEGLERDGNLSPLQRAFVETGAIQCVALAGNLCRCSGYVKMVDAVWHAASAGDGQ